MAATPGRVGLVRLAQNLAETLDQMVDREVGWLQGSKVGLVGDYVDSMS